MKVDLTCSVCGSNDFSITEAHSDACEIFCGDCGHSVGTLAALKDKVADAVINTSRRRPQSSAR